MLDASRYLAGLTIDCYQGRKVSHQARWGKAGEGKDGAGGDSVFPSDIAMLVKNILNYASSDSHTYEELPSFGNPLPSLYQEQDNLPSQKFRIYVLE